MAKNEKKPQSTPEEKKAALVALTSSVASISHFGIKKALAPPLTFIPKPEPVPTSSVSAEVPSATDPVTTEPITAAPASIEPPLTGQEQEGENVVGVGEGRGASVELILPTEPVEEPTKPVTPPVGVVKPTSIEPEELVEEELPSVGEAEPVPAATSSGYDITTVFVPSKVKKTVLIRISPDNQDFFMNMGAMLGMGASTPDIVHNILSQWREAYEGQAQKAMQKRLRQFTTKKT